MAENILDENETTLNLMDELTEAEIKASDPNLTNSKIYVEFGQGANSPRKMFLATLLAILTNLQVLFVETTSRFKGLATFLGGATFTGNAGSANIDATGFEAVSSSAKSKLASDKLEIETIAQDASYRKIGIDFDGIGISGKYGGSLMTANYVTSLKFKLSDAGIVNSESEDHSLDIVDDDGIVQCTIGKKSNIPQITGTTLDFATIKGSSINIAGKLIVNSGSCGFVGDMVVKKGNIGCSGDITANGSVNVGIDVNVARDLTARFARAKAMIVRRFDVTSSSDLQDLASKLDATPENGMTVLVRNMALGPIQDGEGGTIDSGKYAIMTYLKEGSTSKWFKVG